ncbi:hypothetical protein PV516_18885 [Streptomyces scabiei]|uniref:hypothetical protein n=1 Tax=Streptomyces scabiei TaxID=1930 RepID=UPI0029A64B6C|nr:hypothetical protein [Streptomyces scabiei]MDX3165853.1 hypothetical protein [Streptomyces scabiei]
MSIEVTNEVRARYGRALLAYYDRARAALGHDPDLREDVGLVWTACALGGSQDRWDPVHAEDLARDADWACEVLGDLVSNLFHAADGVVIPRLLLDAVAASESRGQAAWDEAARAEAWRLLGERGPRFARLLISMRRALLTVHGVDADGLFDGARNAFEDEVEEERYDAVAARRA